VTRSYKWGEGGGALPATPSFARLSSDVLRPEGLSGYRDFGHGLPEIGLCLRDGSISSYLISRLSGGRSLNREALYRGGRLKKVHFSTSANWKKSAPVDSQLGSRSSLVALASVALAGKGRFSLASRHFETHFRGFSGRGLGGRSVWVPRSMATTLVSGVLGVNPLASPPKSS